MTYEELLREYDLTSEFTLAVKEELDKIPSNVSEAEVSKRCDLRKIRIVTIDGPDAKDFDDAISIEKISEDTFKLGVHIADVSHYVKSGSEIDKEAYSRGTSIYLIDKVISMLHTKLSNGICSLKPHEDRLTLSIFMEINKYGGVEKYDVCEGVINSANRMTYEDVTAILAGDKQLVAKYSDHVDDFRKMEELAKALRKRRTKRGSIDFNIPEPKIVLDISGKPTDIRPYETTISNSIIEEFMLVANETIAEHLNKLEVPMVYRVHENPEGDKVKIFSEMLKGLGYKTKFSQSVSPRQFQDILKQVEGKEEERAISTVMLRSMMKARYSEKNLGHFGLAAQYYCHFTSPIRRYPDLVVHRILKEWLHKTLNDKKIQYYANFTEAAAKQSSDTEVVAMETERTWNQVKMCEYAAERLGEETMASISSITSFGFYVELPNLIEGLVPMHELKDDYYEFDAKHYILRGRRTKREYRIGDTIRVKLAHVDLEMNHIDFIPVEDSKPKKKKLGRRKG